MFKKLLSSALCIALLATAVPTIGMTASADETKDYGLAEKTSQGVILHAFNWSYNTIKDHLPEIAEAGYTTVQTSPVQTPKDFGGSMDTAGQWWKLYQPLSFSIAESSWLGNKQELTDLCAEAEKYGIKIICDIVSNHMANDNEGNPLTYYPDIEKYEPEIYADTTKYFHQQRRSVDDSRVEYIVQGHLDGLPDLNTGDEFVQNRVISLLKECIDCGVDGFRFDAAKHIETPGDGDFASDYWPNVINAATQYAQSKGEEIFCYGEILNTPGSDRNIKDYTKYLNITDNVTGDSTLVNVIKKNPERIITAQQYKYDDDHSNYVLWAESHDTYMGKSGSAGLSNTADVSNEDVAKAWAIVAARGESQALYLARPGLLMGEAGDNAWKSTVVSEINKFHNKFIGTADSIYNDGSVVAVQRGDTGIVLVNLGDTSDISVTTQGMKDGEYTDTLTGGKFTVSNGVISGTVGASGVAIVYEGAETTPRVIFSEEGKSFKTNTLTVTLTLENAEKGIYKINNGNTVEFTDKAEVTIGEGVEVGSVIEITVTATDGNKTTENTQKYTKAEGNNSGVFVYFDNSKKNWKNVMVYAFYEKVDDKGNKELIASNGNWPGVPIEFDSSKNLYFYELPKDLKVNEAVIIFNDGNGTQSKDLPLTSDCMILEGNKWSNYNPNGKTLIYGDVNGDKKVTAADALVILRQTINLVIFNDELLAAADVDQDGKVSARDSMAIQRYSVHIGQNEYIGKEFVFGSSGKQDTEDTDKDIPKSENTFYAVNAAGWIFHSGCKLWLVNNDTKEAVEMIKSDETDNAKYAYVDLPTGWKNISLHRTQWNMTIEESVSANDASYKSWDCGEITEGSNAYKISDGRCKFISYQPE